MSETRILVVDDENLIRWTLRKNLEKAGYKSNPLQDDALRGAYHIHEVAITSLTRRALEDMDLQSNLADRCKNFFAIGLMSWMYSRPVEPTKKWIHDKFGKRPEVLNAIEGHHGDIPATSPYTPIVMAADAISASRPGGRRESLERYIQRLQQLEDIAKEYEGVKEAFAIQAGREVRVIVDAQRVDDAMAASISRDVAKKIEEQMTYPGEIRVTVLREIRAVAMAR